MNHRIFSLPISCALVLSLVLGLPLVSKAQPPATTSDEASSIIDPSTIKTVPLSQVVAQTATSTTATVPPKPTATATTPALPPHTISYTVVAGDSLTGLAKKFNTTRKHLKDLNNLASSKVTPGQVLLIPSTKKSASATAAKAKARQSYAMAQPVQDFDVPASTFGSCPVPLPSPEDDAPSTTASADNSTDSDKPAPIAKLVSPAEVAEQEAEQQKADAAAAATKKVEQETKVASMPMVKPAPQSAVQNTNSFSASSTLNRHSASSTSTAVVAPLPYNPPTPRLNSHNLRTNNLSPTLTVNPYATTSADEWASKFLQQARMLGDRGIEYDDSWRPPGESHSWAMDCSNTSRYLYKVTAGILLPRTASDQYYYLHLQGKAWDVPQTAGGWADTNYLRSHLKPGDLLFWENTYRPERQPPITHVMVFLGTNDRGQWIMAGSQSSRGGEHNRRNGGPDIYVFKPAQACGGYTTWMGLVHHQGRFCAYGRPLDADRTKLSVADDN